MYVVIVHHMDDADLMDDVVFLFFCYMMDERDFSLLQLPPYSYCCIYERNWNMKGNIALTYRHRWNMKGNITLTSVPVTFIMMDVFGLVMTCISL